MPIKRFLTFHSSRPRVRARITSPIWVLRHLSGKARGLRILLVWKGRATPPNGMDRRPNRGSYSCANPKSSLLTISLHSKSETHPKPNTRMFQTGSFDRKGSVPIRSLSFRPLGEISVSHSPNITLARDIRVLNVFHTNPYGNNLKTKLPRWCIFP